MTKKIFYVLTAMLMLSGIVCQAQSQCVVRYNYIKNGYTYTGTERVRVSNGKDMPLSVKLSRVDLGSQGDVYLLHIDFEDATAWKMPKNAPLKLFVGDDAKPVTLRNSFDSPNLVAPSGIGSGANKVWWNCGEYYLEDVDMKKLAGKVSAIEVTKRWSANGTAKISYAANELGNVLSAQYQAIKQAGKPSVTIGSNLNSIQDRAGSRLADTKQIAFGGNNSVSLSYLYYAPSNSESYDLNVSMPGYSVPLNSPITVRLSDGTFFKFRQEKEMLPGKVLFYPSAEQLRKMAAGVSGITVGTTSGDVALDCSDGKFAAAVAQLYNEIQTVAIL